MTHQEKLDWMAIWCAKMGLQLELKGECGIGRECVGVVTDGSYPDYEWHDDKTWDRIDRNGEVWAPPDAYHKHPCVAVLGRGEHAESQLYDWLKWFDENNFKLEKGAVKSAQPLSIIEVMLGKHRFVRLVRQTQEV